MTFAPSVNRCQPVLWFAALALLIVGAEHVVTTLPVFRQRPELPVAVTLDLLVLVPGLFYFLVMRRYGLPLSSLAGIVAACLTVAFWLIPLAQQQPLRALRFLPAVLEGGALVLLAAKARRLVQAYRAARAAGLGTGPGVRAAVQTLGLPGQLLVAEAEMLRYALLGWWMAPEIRPGAAAFSNYRESGFPAFVATAVVVLAVETSVVHLLASHWSAALAGWLLVADVYAVLFVIAHGHAVRLRPTVVTAEGFTVRVGFLWTVAVARAELVAVAPLRDAPAAGAGTLNLSKHLFTPPNLLLTFAAPLAVTGPYGFRRTAHRVAVYLDQPRQFAAAAGFPSTLPPR